MRLLLWMVCAGALVCASHQAPRLLLAAPSLVPVGVEVGVVLQAEGAAGRLEGTVYFQNEMDTRQKCSPEVPFSLGPETGYMQRLSLKVSPELAVRCGLAALRRDRYLQLVARSQHLPPPRTQTLRLAWTSRRGHLFIQTDKPVYTPRQKVHFRVFALNHELRPTAESVTITILNSQGLQVRKVQQFSRNSVITDQLAIPDISEPGTWRITARFSNALESNSSAEFEVKKYVLPRFEVKMIPDRTHMLVTGEGPPDLRIDLQVRFVYGKGVNGVAYLRFGVSNEAGDKTFLRGLEQQLTVNNGAANVTLRRDLLVQKLGRPLRELAGTNLYVTATVIETASGELEEQELSTVKFVTSPYSVDLSRTKRHFVPGVPFLVLARVTLADGSPAPQTPVWVSAQVSGDSAPHESRAVADENGLVVVPLNLGQGASALTLKVVAGEPAPAEASLRAVATQAPSRHYLHLSASWGGALQPGQSLALQLQAIGADAFNYFYYMVLHRGSIVAARHVARAQTSLTAVSIPVTAALAPAFRVVAFYRLDEEVVADSLWVDVEDVCEGKLELRPDQHSQPLRPHNKLGFTVVTDSPASVSLVAVDSAVYVVNRRHRLTPAKVFEALGSYDLGCTPGSGADALGVFGDAGLALRVGQLQSPIHRGHRCGPDASRRKRSLDFQLKAQEKASRYQADPVALQCCRDGMTQVPMRRTCEQRATRIGASPDSRCQLAFLDCCRFATKLRRRARAWGPGGLARVDPMVQEDDFFDEDDAVQTRSVFPESWLWKTITVDRSSRQSHLVPDSITTWEIQAISMSPSTGICVSDPLSVRVFQDFHISLQLPYSVKRFEQLELRPVLYNYLAQPVNVSVYMERSEGICAPATGGRLRRQAVQVPAQGALAVPFALVPMGAADIPVTVTAVGSRGISDSITRSLRVQREGAVQLDEMSFLLDSEDRRSRSLEIPGQLPPNAVPHGDFKMSVRVTADTATETLENSLSPAGLAGLLRVPQGCAEQTMIYMAPGLYAMRYLDETEQWAQLAPERKAEGLENLRLGYERILTFRKTDGSYGAWLHRDSSTWLTAFVVKVLALSRQYQAVDDAGIRQSVQWLLGNQQPDGSFQDPEPVIHREMQGGVGGKQGSVSLTAFVVLSLKHARVAYEEPETDPELEREKQEQLERLRKSLVQATQHLSGALEREQLDPYPAAITAYALSWASTNASAIAAADARLRELATQDRNGTVMYWVVDDQGRLQRESRPGQVPPALAISIETTGYGLLHLLLRNDIPAARKVARWLVERRNYGGGFQSTQDTVVALDALSQFWIMTYSQEENNLGFTFSTPGKSAAKKITLDKSQNQIQEELQFSLGDNLRVKVEGKGKGTLTVLKLYHVLELHNSSCKSLGLEVTVSGDVRFDVEEDEDYDYNDGGESPAAEAPLHPIHWFDARRRRRREAADPSQRNKDVAFSVCIWRQPGARLSGMAIADITLLSGFQPHMDDLDKLKDLADRYISHYELQGQRLLLYFETVPQEKDCVGFRATQTVSVGLLQPASASLYDFYEPAQRCSIFYSAPARSRFVSALCSEDVGQCAEGACPRLKRTLEDEVTEEVRMEFACYSPRVHYGYEVRVQKLEELSGFRAYEAEILEPLQFTEDVGLQAGQRRWFLVRASCRIRLVPGRRYLLMGQDGETRDPQGHSRYLLDAAAWIEELPETTRCRATAHRNRCAQLRAFADGYRQNGCKV
ncbi:complement C4-A [Emydura macquarii macquarii]|uniref:complement C4-A n=1 Tax=Emydura macquarii macquarii TaxID=1129001 RepID=UPI00352B22C1